MCVTNFLQMFLLVMTHYVNQLEIIPGEQQVVEVLGVDILVLLLGFHRLDQGRNYGPGPLDHMVQVPGGK